MPSHDRVFSIFMLFTLVLAGVPALAASDASVRPWVPRMAGSAADAERTAPADLALSHASYEVDVLGAVAVGVLVQEFSNTGENDLVVNYSAQTPSGLRVDSVEMDLAGEVHDLLAAETPERKGKSGRQPRRAPQPKAAAPVVLGAGQTAVVRSSFQMTLTLNEGRFRIRLPAIAGASDEASAAEVMGAVTVNVYHEEPLLHAESSTHDVFVAFEGNRSVVELARGEVPSHEFELDFAMGVEDDASLLGYVGSEKDGIRDVVVVFTPPMEPNDEAVRPKQVLFVLDTSGSMAKSKIDEARRALSTCLEKMTPADLLNIVRFNTGFKMWSEEPVEASAGALDDARAWLDRSTAGGGTQMLPALGATMEQPEAQDHHRMIIILTDGAISDKDKVLALLDSGLGDGRLFVVGIGADVKEDTIVSLAEYGRGNAAFARDPEFLDTALSELFDSVSRPLAWDLQIDWGSAEVTSMQPQKLPDLYAGRPVTIHARVRGEVPDSLSIGASTTSGERVFSTTLPAVGEDGPRRLPEPARRAAPEEKKPARSGRSRR